jgi:hypothetical protein
MRRGWAVSAPTAETMRALRALFMATLHLEDSEAINAYAIAAAELGIAPYQLTGALMFAIVLVDLEERRVHAASCARRKMHAKDRAGLESLLAILSQQAAGMDALLRAMPEVGHA